MPQMEVSEYTFTHTSNENNYIDLTKSDTLANFKGKYQFKNGRPLAYVLSARLSDPSNEVRTVPTNWVVSNALVKTHAAWTKMYKKAGLTRKDLNTYGKEPRFAYNDAHRDAWGLDSKELIADNLPDRYTSSQYNENGDQVVVYTIRDAAIPEPANFVQAFDHTTLTVPSFDGSAPTEEEWRPYVVEDGAAAGDAILTAYILSRGTVDLEDEDMEASELVDSRSRLKLMLSDNEESADDVVEDHRDHGDYRPYELASAATQYTTAISPGANVAGQDTTIIAPLGLIKWSGGLNDKLFIRVEAIIEM